MKKLFWMPLAVLAVFALAFAGCGGGDDDVAVTGITLDPAAKTLTKADASFTLTATVEPADATKKDITWSVEKDGVVTMSEETGVSITVTRKEGGYVKVIATSVSNPAVKAECSITSEGLALDAYFVQLGVITGVTDVEDYAKVEIAATLIPAGDAKLDVAFEDGDDAKVTATVEEDKITITATDGRVREYGEDSEVDEDYAYAVVTITPSITTIDPAKVEVDVIKFTAQAILPSGIIYNGTPTWLVSTQPTVKGGDTPNTAAGAYAGAMIAEDIAITFTQPLDVRKYKKVVITFDNTARIWTEWWFGGTVNDAITGAGDKDYFKDLESGEEVYEFPIETVDFLGYLQLGGGHGSGNTEWDSDDGRTGANCWDGVKEIKLVE